MFENTTTERSLAVIGEEIGLELGNVMIRSYQIANPFDTQSYIVGRQILDSILNQPNCKGIQMYNAYNEKGEKTLVYVGLAEDFTPITKYTIIEEDGSLTQKAGIVADRIKVPMPKGGVIPDADDWTWSID